MMRAGMHDLVDLVLPLRCAGCGDCGVSWCAACATASAMPVRRAFAVDFGATVAAGARVQHPGLGHPPRTWAATWFVGPLAHALVQYKDGQRRDLARLFGPALQVSILAAAERITPVPEVLVVPIPSSSRGRKRRGDSPLLGLVAAAFQDSQPRCGYDWGPAVRFCCVDVLRQRRRTADQRELDRAQRAANVRHSMVCSPLPVRVGGVVAPVLLVDDVCTTGATLAEAARAVLAAGAPAVVAAVLAATPKQRARRG